MPAPEDSRPMRRAFAIIALALPLLAYGNSARAISDPIEPFNRAMFAFNEFLLNYLIDPVAGFAQSKLSPGVRQAATNMYLNLSEPEFIATNLLQGKFADS